MTKPTSVDSPTFCILGAGNGGLARAGHLALKGFREKDLATTGNIATAVGSLLTAAAAACPPIAPFVGIIAAYVALEFVLLQNIDGGYGVMLSATWVAPGLLVPTRLQRA